MKVLIAVTHLLGVGHLARAAALGRAFARAGHEVALISGGRPAPNVPMTGVKLVQLPSLHAKGTDFRTLYDDFGVVADDALMAERSRICREYVRAFRPDAAIIELFPFGRRQLASEFAEMLVELANLGPETLVFSSVRDVLAPPGSDAKAAQTFERLGRWFDGVLVHGDEAVLPLEASWPVMPALARKLTYTGYVRDQETAAAAGGEGTGSEGANGEVVVSGGGSAASLPLLHAALGAARLRPALSWRLLAGHGVPEAAFAALQRECPANAIVERVRRDFDALLRRAACSVSQAGYNTMLDLAAVGTPAVVVPFAAGNEVEQTIRAERFAAMGLCDVVSEAALTPEALAGAVDAALARGGKGEPRLAMDGAVRSVSIVEAALAERQAEAAAWARVRNALDRLAASNRTADFWWRDDDAIEPTPDLDRLLELARRHDVPLALAVIPERASPALARRLAGESGVDVLVHGMAHANNAPAHAKKQELVAATAKNISALSAAKARLSEVFGAQSLPILTPPWNRISGDFLPLLPELGFRGLSTFGPEEKMPPAPGICWINTHLDPVDWKAGGGLVRVSAHIAHLADMLEKQSVDNLQSAGPVGLLTHHLAHDPWIWRHLDVFLSQLLRHKAVRFKNARLSFGLT